MSGISAAKAAIRGRSQDEMAATLGSWASAATTWGFGLWSVGLLLKTGVTLMQDAAARVSLLGTNGGVVRETWGLTYGGAGGLFDRQGWSGLAGLEGAMLAAAQAAIVLLALICTLIPSKDARVFAGCTLVLWSGLWGLNAAHQSIQAFSPTMAAALALSMIVIFMAAHHTGRLARAAR